MRTKITNCLVILAVYAVCCYGYRNTASEVRYIDELLTDREETDRNSIIQTREHEKTQSKRSVEDSDLITNSLENNEDDLMAVENGKNNVERTEYAFHEPGVSNYESDDIMTVASPALITEETRDLTGDIMTHVANERQDILEAVATKSEITREKRSKSTKKANKRSNTSDKSGDLSSIFSEIQSSKHHKLTRSDIRKLAKHAVLLASLGKLDEKSEKANKKTNIKSKKSSKKSKSKHGKKEKKKKTGKQKKKVVESENKESTANVKDSKMVSGSSIGEDTKQANTETPGVNDEKNKPLTETTDGKETKEEVVAENVNTKETKTEGPPAETNNGTEDIPKTNPEKPILTISGRDMGNNSDSVATVIKNSKDAWNKSSEFSEDLTKNDAKITSIEELSDDALFNAINKNNTPELDNHTMSIETMLQKEKPLVEPLKKPSQFSTSKKELTNTTTSMEPTSPSKANVTTHDEKDTSDDVIIKRSKIERVEPITQNSSLPKNETKKSDVPTGNVEIRNKINKLKDIIAKTTPDKIPQAFLPELPSGLRMIAWKQLLEKKKKQLAELVSAYTNENSKPVTININIDHDAKNHIENSKSDQSIHPESIESTTGETGTKKTALPDHQDESQPENNATNTTDPKVKPEELNSHHVKYLQKHIKSARSLRKLIAKTLIGHCKSTGKRILEAFIAMDKALERAQAIAEVIGKKFHVNPDKIQNLVGNKEDEVVETFLRDIFTKL